MRRLLYSGERERNFESVGSSCVKCNLDCGDIDLYNMDHHAIGAGAQVEGSHTYVSLCSHPGAPLKEGESGSWLVEKGSEISSFRICLIKTPNLNPDAKIEY